MYTRITRMVRALFSRYGWTMRTELIVIFLLVKMIPLVLLSAIAWHQFLALGDTLTQIAVDDSTGFLNDKAIKNIEHLTLSTARRMADFLYDRDIDIISAAKLPPTEEAYRAFLETGKRLILKRGRWELVADSKSWIGMDKHSRGAVAISTNREKDDKDGFHSAPPYSFEYAAVPLYDEITFLSPDGRELVKVVASDSPKIRYPLKPEKRDVSVRANTYIKAETYFSELAALRQGEIYVSDVIGAYVGTNYVGIYTPGNVAKAATERDYDIEYQPLDQAYAGQENPNGRRFEGIIRWATPIMDAAGELAGYVTLALNHDHIMEFVDHITPLDERYVELPSAADGNYAFIWDYQCRNIGHPRHHSIVGFDPETGDPQIPWLETSIYDGWRKSGLEKWIDYVKDYPKFHEQSRSKKPAAALTRAGLVGLDGRYLNNAPQCTGWMDLTGGGGSGSFYILWSGVYKLNAAAAIPYYTGRYAPSETNGHSRRGFGFVTIGTGLDYFTQPARDMGARLLTSIGGNITNTLVTLIAVMAVLLVAVIFAAIWMAWHISAPIRAMAGNMSRLAIGDIAGDGVRLFDRERRDEIGLLARSLHDLTLARREELEITNAIAGGDYTRSIALRSDLDLLGKAINAMVAINKRALLSVNQAVEDVGIGANAVSNVSISLSEGVQTSELVLKELSETVGSVDRQARDNVVHARDASRLAVDSRDAAHRGYGAVSELAAAMTEIQGAGKKIASVAKLIDDIAFQTNLLALNASVEAARAGKHGRGFSVVADEVRNLSSRSARAAHDTSNMVESMLKLMETGTQMASRSDQEFRGIVDTIARVAKLFENIVEASGAQSSSMAHMVRSLGKIDTVTKENSLNAEQMAAAAKTLADHAEALRSTVSRFRLSASLSDESPQKRRSLPFDDFPSAGG